MLSLEDCIAFSGLTPDQLDAIARFKHLPTILAAEWAENALETRRGCEDVERMLVEEALLARRQHLACAEAWRAAAEEFHRDHAMA
ncbi:MAG: hypothetical protein M0006_00745 [Magnetospirillum sp.]|nr:hypothetical protein [Magnetospirillum sp.]